MEGVHHFTAEQMRRDFAAEILFESLKDVGAGVLEGLPGDWAFLAGFEHSIEELVPVKRFTAAVAFNDPQVRSLDLLVGRESGAACHTFPPAANAPSVLGQAGVNHLVLHVAAFGTVHLVVLGRFHP
jgi:hypothetical protein